MKNTNNNLINLDQGVIQTLNFLKDIKLPVLTLI